MPAPVFPFTPQTLQPAPALASATFGTVLLLTGLEDPPSLPGTLPGDIWAADGAAHAAITERRAALEEASGS